MRAALLLLSVSLAGCPSLDEGVAKTQGGAWMVEIEDPEVTEGWADLDLYVLDLSTSAPALGLGLTADVERVSSGESSSENIETTELGSGNYRVEAFFQATGAWTLQGSLSNPSTSAQSFTLDVDVVAN